MYSEWKCWKNILVFCNSFCKACCDFKSCMNKACWKSCCRQQIQTITLLTRGYKFQHRNLHQSVEILPILQEVLLSEFFAGKSNFSKALLMQLLKAKEALQKELHNTNRFFEFFCPYSCLYACNCNSNPIGPQNIFFKLFLPTMLVLHSKAAKTECLDANTGGGAFQNDVLWAAKRSTITIDWPNSFCKACCELYSCMNKSAYHKSFLHGTKTI